MKIDDIIELIKSDKQRCENDSCKAICPEGCEYDDAAYTLERLRSVTITDDPATWPE